MPAAKKGNVIQTANVEPTKDVEHLVQEIKENLKLGHYNGNGVSGGGKAASRFRPSAHGKRASPYAVPPSSRAGNPTAATTAAVMMCDSAEQRRSELKRWNHQRRRYPSTCMNDKNDKKTPDNPFEMLQELITDGSLIKEAVRRLQLGLTPKYNTTTSFYDSDEECRTPPEPEADLEADLEASVGGPVGGSGVEVVQVGI